MTSNCYIFVAHKTKPILAGRYMIDNKGLGHFIYGKTYLANPNSFALDPINLPFTDPLQTFNPINCFLTS